MRKTIIFMLMGISFLYSQTLSLKECIESAIKNNPDVNSMLYRLHQSKEDMKSERAAYLPRVDVTLEYSPIKTFVMPSQGEFLTEEHSATHADITIYQKIYDFKKTSSKIEAAVKNARLAELSSKEMQNLLILNIKQLYDSMILEKFAIKVAREDMMAKEELYRQAKAFVISGIRTKVDEARFYAAFLEAKDALKKAEADYTKSIILMQSLTSMVIEKEIGLEDRLEKSSAAENSNEERLRDQMAQKNLLLLAEASKIEKANSLFTEAKSQYYPDISAYAVYAQEDTLSSYDTTAIGLRAVIPIYSGGSQSARKEKARLGMLLANEEYASKKLSLNKEMESLLIDAKRYESTIEAKKSIALSAKEAYGLMKGRYKEGLATYLEVLDSADFYNRSELSYIKALFEKSAILHRIDYLVNSDEEYLR